MWQPRFIVSTARKKKWRRVTNSRLQGWYCVEDVSRTNMTKTDRAEIAIPFFLTHIRHISPVSQNLWGMRQSQTASQWIHHCDIANMWWGMSNMKQQFTAAIRRVIRLSACVQRVYRPRVDRYQGLIVWLRPDGKDNSLSDTCGIIGSGQTRLRSYVSCIVDLFLKPAILLLLSYHQIK